MLNIFLIRHGQSEANEDRKILRERNLPDYKVQLTNTGRKQAELAAKFLGGQIQCAWRVKTRIYNSPYERARETTNIIRQNMFYEQEMDHPDKLITLPQVSCVEHDMLAEQSYGLFDAYEDDELAAHFPKEHAYFDKADKYWHAPPQGESRFQVVQRQHIFAYDLLQAYREEEIKQAIIVCHGVTMRALIKVLMQFSYEWMEDTKKHPNPKNCEIRQVTYNTGSRPKYEYNGIVWTPPAEWETK